MSPSNKSHASVQLGPIIFLAWQNLIFKRLRSILTILGIAVGIGAIFFLLSVSLGLQDLVADRLVGGNSIKTIDVSSAKSELVVLDEKAAERIKLLPNIEKIGVSYAAPGILKYQGSESSGPVYGVDVAYQELSDVVIKSGRGFNTEDSNGLLVSEPKLRSMGIANPESMLNKSIELTIPMKDKDSIDVAGVIIGIVQSESESIVFAPKSVFSDAGQVKYSQIKLIANNLEDVPTLRRQIESIGFETVSPADTLDQVNQIFRYFNLVLIGFGAIGMIVAILGMFNTLTISLLERTKEIGLMFALGSRKRDMRRLFVVEAVLLSIIGSAIGIVSSVFVGQVVNVLMNRMARSRGVQESFQLFSTPLWLVFGLTLFMVLVGLAVVFFPARRAERTNPIEALRRE